MVDLNMPYNKDVDARGLSCPLPILRAKRALADLDTGDVLRVQATDPGSERDFTAFAKQTGNELVAHGKHENVFYYFLRRRT
jgi:tRNA 2-thiouridine synthesizing protein A